MNRFYALLLALAATCFLSLTAFVAAPHTHKVLSRKDAKTQSLLNHGFASSRLCVTPPSGDLIDLDTVLIRLDKCSATGHLCLPITLGQALSYTITDNGDTVQLDLQSGCDFDTTSAYTYSTLFGVGTFGPYILTSWPVGSQIFQDTFNTMPELVDSMNHWDPQGNWMLDPAHLLITGGHPGTAYDTMKVWVVQINSPSYIGYNYGVTPRGTEMSFKHGFHKVTLFDPASGMRDSFCVRAVCNERANRVIAKDSTGKFCLDFGDLVGFPTSLNICSTTSSAVSFKLDANGECVEYTGKFIGTSTACIVACDATGFCDTTYLKVKVTGTGGKNIYQFEIALGMSGVVCPDTTNFDGPVASVKICNNLPTLFSDFLLDPATGCLHFTGLHTGGTDTVCVVACDAVGTCDTSMVMVKVHRIGPDWRRDTLFLNQIGRQCVDQTNMPGTPVLLELFRAPNPLMLFTNLDQNNFCVAYLGLKAGRDTLGVRLKDTQGNYDSTFVEVLILKPQTLIISDSLKLGETRNFCLDTSELGGKQFVIDNLCKNLSDRHVSFDVNDLTLCLELQAISPGTDTACITLCDNLGVCDTVIFLITAFDDVIQQVRPVANADFGISQFSQPVVLPVLDNDTIAPPRTEFRLLPASGPFGPAHGTAEIDTSTGRITFTPDPDFCNSTDNFQYVVCNSAGCDTALVTVMVTCDTSQSKHKIVVFDAFSPNGDGTNEAFTIRNVEFYPQSITRVYSRWGTQVFEAVGYQNDWGGTWSNSKLPDGTYFYYFNDGADRIWKGVLLIKR